MSIEVTTLADLIDMAAAKYGRSEAIVFEEQRLTYEELHHYSKRLAKGLIKLGINKGDKIALWMGNCPEYEFCEFAIFKAGGIVIPLNTRFKVEELGYILGQSDASMIMMADQFLANNFTDMIYDLIPQLADTPKGQLNISQFPFLRHVICRSEKVYRGILTLNEVLTLGDAVDDKVLRTRQQVVNPEDVVCIPYTSGTTGFPKGVITTNIQYLKETYFIATRLGIREGDRFCTPTPFSFNFGNVLGPLMATMFGGCVIPLAYFDPEKVFELIHNEKCTNMMGTPTIYIEMLRHPKFNQYDLSSLRTGVIGAAPSPVQLIEDIIEKMGIRGLVSAYGMTENSGATTVTQVGDPPDVIAATVGKPLPDVEIKIVDPQTGKDLGREKQGEVCTRGWLVTTGYYKMPEETAKVLSEDGWFHTGDLGTISEEGNLKITGRLKDMFITGGINVYPTEVENFLFRHPKVKQVSVVGVSDQKMGEVGAAFIILKKGERSSPEEIIDFCKGKIANYKVPKYVKIVEEFPLNAVGKVQKFKLKSMIEK
jgi:fatty-acyl-CoA synthase